MTFTHTVQSLRRERYRLTDDAPHITTTAGALSFIDELGVCLLFPNKGIELPDLWRASAVSRRQVWRWKDSIPAARRAYYGRFFRRRPGFISLDLLPAVYALSATFLCNGDRFELYKKRYISSEVNRIAGVLTAKGPCGTRELRRHTGLAARHHRSRFRRALADAEGRFLAAKAGTTTTASSHYTYLWDSFPDVWPDVARRAADLSTEQAGRQVISRYVTIIAAARPQRIAWLFGLHLPFVEYVADQLIADGLIGQVTHDGAPYLVSPDLLSRL